MIASHAFCRFNGRSIPDLGAVAGDTLDDLSQGVAFRSIPRFAGSSNLNTWFKAGGN